MLWDVAEVQRGGGKKPGRGPGYTLRQVSCHCPATRLRHPALHPLRPDGLACFCCMDATGSCLQLAVIGSVKKCALV